VYLLLTRVEHRPRLGQHGAAAQRLEGGRLGAQAGGQRTEGAGAGLIHAVALLGLRWRRARPRPAAPAPA
jgi:hypothetical protein